MLMTYNIDRGHLPKIDKSGSTPKNLGSSYIVIGTGNTLLTGLNKTGDTAEIHQQAVLLAEHMETVKESLRLVENGEYVTWSEFKKAHAKK